MSKPTLAEAVAGLRELADFLEQHPDMPMPWRFEVCQSLEESELEKVGELTGTPVVTNDENGHRTVDCRFGAVELHTAWVPAWRLQESIAVMSYDSNIRATIESDRAEAQTAGAR